jgi:hypothetical protein
MEKIMSYPPRYPARGRSSLAQFGLLLMVGWSISAPTRAQDIGDARIIPISANSLPGAAAAAIWPDKNVTSAASVDPLGSAAASLRTSNALQRGDQLGALMPASLDDATVPLDNHVLSRRRGGALWRPTVAGVPALSRTSVTLWDELVPPSPTPQPVDAERAAQGNSAIYTRK